MRSRMKSMKFRGKHDIVEDEIPRKWPQGPLDYILEATIYIHEGGTMFQA